MSEHNIDSNVRLVAKLQAENARLREALERIAEMTQGQWVAVNLQARAALKEDSEE